MGAIATRVSDEGRGVLAIPRVRRFVDLMVEGIGLKEAALTAGLRVRRARLLMRNPAVRREYFKGIEAILEVERARNVALRVSVRDRGFAGDATAAAVRQSLLAADRLDGIDGRTGATVNVGVTTTVVGYVMDLREDDELGDPSPYPSRAAPIIDSSASVVSERQL